MTSFVLFVGRGITEMSASADSGRRPGILVVDDDAGIRENILDLLATEDYRVFSAADADEALHVLEIEPIDLLITDFQMPGRNGLELIEATRKANHPIPAILMTAYLYVYEQIAEERRQDITLLRKPFDADEILRTIASRLNGGSLGRGPNGAP
jgi:two-component system response regulator FlrC